MEEIGPDILAHGMGRACGGEAKIARHRAGKPVERRAILRGGDEVDPAQHRGWIEPRAPEGGFGELPQRRFYGGELGWEAGDGCAPGMAALIVQTVNNAGHKALRQGGEFGLEFLQPVLKAEGEAPDLLARWPVEVIEEFGEAGQEISFGHQEIYWQILAEAAFHLLEAAADGAGLGLTLGAIEAGKHVDAEGDDDAVERLDRRHRLQHLQEAVPAGLIGIGINILGHVAPCRIDQHGVLINQ